VVLNSVVQLTSGINLNRLLRPVVKSKPQDVASDTC